MGSDLILSPSNPSTDFTKNIEAETTDPEIKALNDAINSSAALTDLGEEKDDIEEKSAENPAPAPVIYDPARYQNPFKTITNEEFKAITTEPKVDITDEVDSQDTTPSAAGPNA